MCGTAATSADPHSPRSCRNRRRLRRRSSGDLGRLGPTPGGVSRGEGHHILGTNRLPSHGTVGELGMEEFAGVASPIGAGGLGQAADIPQVSDVVLDGHIDGIPGRCGPSG